MPGGGNRATVNGADDMGGSSPWPSGRALLTRTNYPCLMLTALGGVLILSAAAVALYLSVAIAPAAVRLPEKLVYERAVYAGGDPATERLRRQANEFLVRALGLVRSKRQLADSNTFDREEASEELPIGPSVGYRRRVQRENGKTWQIAYRNGRGGPAAKQHNDIIRAVKRRKRRAAVSLEGLAKETRHAEQEHHRLQGEYNRCRKEAPNGAVCEKIYGKLRQLTDEINVRFREMTDLLQEIQLHKQTMPITTEKTKVKPPTTYRPSSHVPVQNPNVTTLEQLLDVMNITHPPFGSAEAYSTEPTVIYDPKQHKPTENRNIQSLDDLLRHMELLHPNETSTADAAVPVDISAVSTTPRTASRSLHDTIDQSMAHGRLHQPYPVHEDLLGLPGANADIDELVRARSRNRDHLHHDLPHPELEHRSVGGAHPLGPSAPFLSLCEQLRSAGTTGLKTHASQWNNFHASNQPGIPITGGMESMKGTSQIVVNSGYGIVPNTVCFYQTPVAAMPYRPGTPGAYAPTSYSQPGGKPTTSSSSVSTPPLNDPAVEAFIQPRFPTAMINMPVSIYNPLRRDGANNADQGQSQSQDPFVLCSVMQPMPMSMPMSKATNGTATEESSPDDLDAIFAAGQSAAARAKGRHHCRRGYVPCFSSHQCVKKTRWCDAKTDCMDGSDESACSCVSRLPKRKLCDGYADCPLGMDEMGCFGCDKFAFSCFHTADEHRQGHKAGPQCYTVLEKCDGYDHCLNRKDEQDCTMLARNLGHYLAYAVPHSSGILHRNYRGRWYPVCENPVQWAREACEAEVGSLEREPTLSHQQGNLPGPFISQRAKSGEQVMEPAFTDQCNGVYVQVKCPPVRCGTSKVDPEPGARINVRVRRNSSAENELVESVRIVGGTDAESGAYPFIVGIFRDGKFHCGGSIVSEHWIVSAAHCCDDFHRHYFEGRAGLLRKRSFAPQVQVTRLTHVIVHHAYDPMMMSNDISMMRTEHPLHFNRWVRPICLPSKQRSADDREWVWGPKAGTMCTAVGWGALREKGGVPDQLKEVSVPVLARCKHKSDRDGLQICAGEEEGGHDACQGDSGGPFACRSQSKPHEWYLAGVVSHGEGCARAHEPGVYTRVTLFLDWIQQKMTATLPQKTTLPDCPGMRCIWGGSICLPADKRCNGYVNCLGGEDESNCPMDELLRSMFANDADTQSDENSEMVEGTLATLTVANVTTAATAATEKVAGTIELSTTTQQPTTDTASEFATTDELLVDTTSTTVESLASTELPPSSSVIVTTIELSTTTQQPTTDTVSETTGEFATTDELLVDTTSTTVESLASTELPPSSSSVIVTTENLTTDSAADATETVPAVQLHSTTTEDIWKAIDKTIKDLEGGVMWRKPIEIPTATTNAPEPNSTEATVEPEQPVEQSFGDINTMHREKHKRLSQFRMTAHNAHMSQAKPKTALKPHVAAKYEKFACTNITQWINVAHHCDRIVDCEDGSDERNCTCRDFLRNKFDFLICDGKTDCLDETDEHDCINCTASQYKCRLSKACIERTQVCDNKPDCPLHEDELDCLALTDGHQIYFDVNSLSLFKHEGFVTKNTNGTWRVVCGAVLNNKTDESVGKICSFLGFAGYVNYSAQIVPADVVSTIDINFIMSHSIEARSYANLSIGAHCHSLYVACEPHINATEHELSHFEHKNQEHPVQISIRPQIPITAPHHLPHIVFQENAHIKLEENFSEDYEWPWNTDLYLEGVRFCSGVIIDASWIIVSSDCMRLVDFRSQYVAMVAGGPKAYLKISGPYEQVVRIDCYHFIPEPAIVLLHLERRLTFNRHVLPTFIPKSDTLQDSECLAVGQDSAGHTITLRVHRNTTNCEGKRKRCYHKDFRQPHYIHEHCSSPHSTRSGVIVCKTNQSGWYPVGFYRTKRGLCEFNEVVHVTSLIESHREVHNVLNRPSCSGRVFPVPTCDGLRCWRGQCIGKSLICDQQRDCGDGADELPSLCATHNVTSVCQPHELRCGNRKCVDKSKFCDENNDCGDLTDEPRDCSCYTYLKLTNPQKICDGVRNCWDKSDENPRLCKCHASSFRCGDRDICIPYDFVCDKERDCPDGEDELYCYALQQNPYDEHYGELMEQSYGIWHSKCFPKDANFDKEYVRQLCHQLGYQYAPTAYGRTLQGSVMARAANETAADGHSVNTMRNVAVKAIAQNKFSKVVLNEKQMFFMRPSRPMFKVINWNVEDEQQCNRLELKCTP